MVIKVVCPEVFVPEAARNLNKLATSKKRSRGDMGWNEEASAYSQHSSSGSSSSYGTGHKQGRMGSSSSGNGRERDDLKALFSTVKDFSSTAFVGMKKKKHNEDKLTKLGAPSVKQQTMPFKMKMGIMAGRKKRTEKEGKQAQESGVILAKVAQQKVGGGSRNHGSGGSGKGSGSHKKSHRRSGDSPSFGLNTKNGVLHLSKKRLPERLTRTSKSPYR